jgi:predicted ester cyclase
MRRLPLGLFFTLGLCITLALAQEKNKTANPATDKPDNPSSASQVPRLNMPGPEVQNLMLGKWAIKVKYEPSEKMPQGGVGEGIEVWRPGPGGRSVIEEYFEKGATGEIEEYSPAWWDEQAGGQRFVFCSNTVPSGCFLSKNVAKWEGNRQVYSEDREENGRKITRQEIFSDITPTSFSQILAEGPVGGELKPVATILATKIPEGRMKSTDSASLEENKALIRKLFEELINKKNLAVMDKLMSSGYVAHPEGNAPPSDVKETQKFLAEVFRSFPDLRVTIEDMVAEGDRVVVRNTWRGTFRNAWNGIAPTAEEVEWTANIIWRLSNGKITDRWGGRGNFPEVMQKIAAAQPHDAAKK